MAESERIFGPTQVAAWGRDLISKLVEEAVSQKPLPTKRNGTGLLTAIITSSDVKEMLDILETVPEHLSKLLALPAESIETELLRRCAIERRQRGPGMFLCCAIGKTGFGFRYKTYQELKYLSAAFVPPAEHQLSAETALLESMVEFPAELTGPVVTLASETALSLQCIRLLIDNSYTGRLLVAPNCTLETTSFSVSPSLSYVACTGSFGGLAAFLLISAALKRQDLISKVKKTPSIIPEIPLAGSEVLRQWWDSLSHGERVRWVPSYSADLSGIELVTQLSRGALGGNSCETVNQLEAARAEYAAEQLIREEALERHNSGSASQNSGGPGQMKKKKKNKGVLNESRSSSKCTPLLPSKCATVFETDESLSTSRPSVAETTTSDSAHQDASNLNETRSSPDCAQTTAIGSEKSLNHPQLEQVQEIESRTRRGSSSDLSFTTISSGGGLAVFGTDDGTISPLYSGSEMEEKWEKAKNRKRKKDMKRHLMASITADQGPASKIPSSNPAEVAQSTASNPHSASLASPQTIESGTSDPLLAACDHLVSPSLPTQTSIEPLPLPMPPKVSTKRSGSTSSSPSRSSRSPSSRFAGLTTSSNGVATAAVGGLSPISNPSPSRLPLPVAASVVSSSSFSMLPPPASEVPIVPVVRHNRLLSTGFTSLHHDIQEMSASLELVATRRQPWQMAVAERVKQVVYSIWPRAWCDVFGSIASGLAAPCSDVDMVVRGVPHQDCVRILAQSLQRQEWVQMVQALERTAVPVVKFKTAAIPIAFGNRGNLIAVDITFENEAHHGLNTCGLVRQFVQRWPPLKPLVLVLKQFLVEKGLNDPYIGGVSSYGLVLMVAALLRRHWPSGLPQDTLPAPDLGLLFIEFLQEYSSKNFVDKGVRFGTGDASKTVGDPCYIEDPLDPTNNVGRSCFGINQVVEQFSKALEAIRTYEREEGTAATASLVTSTLPTSVLGRVFATSHHNDVVRLVTTVWCPPELPSRNEPRVQQRFAFVPPPASPVGLVTAGLPVRLAPASPSATSALERWALETREALLRALSQVEKENPLGTAEDKCPMCSQPKGAQHTSSTCDLYILAKKCPL